MTWQVAVDERAGVSRGISPESYRFLQESIHRESGIVLEEQKHYLLQARLLPILRGEGLETIDDLCGKLRAGSLTLMQRVVEAMTTNETLFFRDATVFESLRTVVIPALMKQREATRHLAFWSAASSSGQEAYSLAMLLLEMGLPAQGWSTRIVGTDLSEHVLDRARKGRYLQLEVNRGLPPYYLIRYFSRQGLEWQLKDNVKSMVTFSRFDLRQSPVGLGPFDLILCRNVLIYFDVPTRNRVLAGLRTALRGDGVLLLGAAEAVVGLDRDYTREVVGQATLYRGVAA